MATIHEDAFVEEIRRVQQTAFGVAYLILKNASDCEDAMSAAILKAYEHRDKLKRRDSFRAWFLRILRNEAYTILRERRKVVETDSFPKEPLSFFEPAETLDLRAAIRHLSADQRNALYLKEQGYSLEEIADVMQVPIGTVKSRIARAKDTLRKLLEDQPNE